MRSNDVQYLWRAALVSTAILAAAVNQTFPAIASATMAVLLTVDSSPEKEPQP
jgi:hypothetical protein